ncbi:hypothetical protein [Lentzea sp. HUAS12]|uniref:hypothetical protein n=1 Tax=Lentzea sp. HUAS12 TaxID=2951806 RepID=UPI0020A21F80|nr:hypothetical protein [Lentzea sp. HUAS12]USX53244.1 hypothetical protein ND450_03855 [Lentzea sp. HUAS12]
MALDAIQGELDGNTLEHLADLICGDDVSPSRRAGWQLPKFLRAAGWTRVPDFDGYRRDWILDQLDQRKKDLVAITQVLLRLADPREYLGDDDVRGAVVIDLNRLLAVEGYQVAYERGRPVLEQRDPSLDIPAMRAPMELTASLADIVTDPAYAEQLRRRLDEAHTCWVHGAATAAIIMLGSVLEGVLYDVARSRSADGSSPRDHLDSLIKLAVREGWIGRDVDDYAHTLREYRNLVHPKRQVEDKYNPDTGTAEISWKVVVLALNDLAESSWKEITPARRSP